MKKDEEKIEVIVTLTKKEYIDLKLVAKKDFRNEENTLKWYFFNRNIKNPNDSLDKINSILKDIYLKFDIIKTYMDGLKDGKDKIKNN